MNPQYMPQHGGPPQGYSQNRPSPALTPQGSFQNVPLGPAKSSVMNGPPPSNFAPPPSGFPQNSGPPHMAPSLNHSHIPPNIGPPPSNMAPPSLNMGPPQSNMAPPSLNMGPLQTTANVAPPSSNMGNIPLPPTNMGPPPSSMAPPQQSNYRPPQSISNLPQSNQIPLGQLPSSQVQQQPQNQQPGPPRIQENLPPMGNQFQNGPTSSLPPQGPPKPNMNGTNQLPPKPPGTQQFMPGQGQPPNQFGQPPNQFNQPPLIGHAPALSGQPPSQFNQPPLSGQFNAPLSSAPPPSQFSQPPGQFNPPPPQPGQFNSSSTQFSQPPLPGQPPNQFNSPPTQFSQPPMANAGQLPGQMQGMNLSGPRQYPGGPIKPMNGENLPHMPPPGQGYVNGQQQQMRSPQGYPPMPGPGQMQAAGPGYQQPFQQAQPQRRLDPDQMPNPIQVTQDDQRTRCGVFCTNQKGLVPPLVTTNFVVQDQGNSSPRLIRSSMYNVPVSQDLMKQTSVPFGLVISPMARTAEGEYPPPIVNFGELGPVRCNRCKAYMAPFMQFVDSGRRFHCLFCKASTDVPNEYFQHLDHTGQRMDRFERPELILGTYEMIATTDYCRNNTLPKPPAIIFLIDVSYNNIKSGLVHLLCSQMKEIIQNLPVDQGQEKSNMRVGFITYNSVVHFYNIKGTLAAPQMLVVGDTQEMFMPLLDGFLCTPEESGPVIDQLMEQIPIMFGDTRETETVLLPAILAGLEALKASDCAGKLLVFHSTLPIADAPGKLKSRDDRKLLGTDKERTVLTPQTQAYNQLGQDCVAAACSVDLFLFNNAYIDIATIGQVSRLTGGEVFKYTYFQADIDGERLISDIITDISRPIAFDAIMRVRTSTGVRPTDFYGHFFMSNTTDMEIAAIDCDKAIAVEVKHDDKLNEEEGVYVQVALLYTSCAGQRRLRIINLSLKTCSQMADLYRSCDLDTIINFFAKQAVYKLLDNNPKAVKDSIVTRAAQMLANYRKNCASPSSAGQLILPECMKLLPLYVNCLLKSDALSGGSDITLDDRSFVMQAVMIMDIPSSVSYFYPRLIPLHELKLETEGKEEIPAPIRCTFEKMNDQGVYLLENGIHMFIWIGLGANQDFVQQVFGVPSAVQIDVDKPGIPELDNPLSIAVCSIVEQIRTQKHRCMRLTLVRQREKLEPIYKHFLAEDRGHDGSPSYVDFLCHMHKEIRTILS